jgi:hypothetical protein
MHFVAMRYIMICRHTSIQISANINDLADSRMQEHFSPSYVFLYERRIGPKTEHFLLFAFCSFLSWFTVPPRRCRYYISVKCLYFSIELHDVTFIIPYSSYNFRIVILKLQLSFPFWPLQGWSAFFRSCRHGT